MSLGIRLKGARVTFTLAIASLLFLTVSVVGQTPSQPTATGRREARAFIGSLFWRCAVLLGRAVPSVCRQPTREPPRSAHIVELHRPVHPPQTEDAALYDRRSVFGSHASIDRMGWSVRYVERGGVGTLRHALPLAVPSLHGDRLDVSRGL